MNEREQKLMEQVVKALYGVAHQDRYDGQLDTMRYLSTKLWEYWNLQQVGRLEDAHPVEFIDQWAWTFEKGWANRPLHLPWFSSDE
jgi:hypothetical protein